MKKTVFTTLIISVFLFCSCGGGNRQAMAANNETSETSVVETIEIVPIDPAIIDIAGNLENRKEFRLSDFGSSVQYIRLQPPEGMNWHSVHNVLSSDDYLFINTLQGLFMYSADGQFISTLAESHLEMIDGAVRIGNMSVSGDVPVLNGDLVNGRLLFKTQGEERVMLNLLDIESLSENPTAPPAFQRALGSGADMGIRTRFYLIDEQSVFSTRSLTASPIAGGYPLFRVENYYQPTITGNVMANVTSTFYRFGEKVMMQLAHNDTVFALIPPNRVEPAFIMNWGDFKPDMNRLANGGIEEGKFVLRNWVETQRHIFIEYTVGRASPRRWAEGNVHHH